MWFLSYRLLRQDKTFTESASLIYPRGVRSLHYKKSSSTSCQRNNVFDVNSRSDSYIFVTAIAVHNIVSVPSSPISIFLIDVCFIFYLTVMHFHQPIGTSLPFINSWKSTKIDRSREKEMKNCVYRLVSDEDDGDSVRRYRGIDRMLPQVRHQGSIRGCARTETSPDEVAYDTNDQPQVPYRRYT